MQNYKVELLDINEKKFNYSYFEGDTTELRALKVYICFRTMFLIDQLHDFLEQEERNVLVPPPNKTKQSSEQTKKDVQTMYENLLSSYNSGISLFSEKLNLQYDELKNQEVSSGKKINSNFLNESLDFFSLFDVYTNKSTKKTISKKTPESEPNIEPVVQVSYMLLNPKENKYKILDEINLILGYAPVNIQEIFFEKNNIPVACSKGYEYIKTFSGFEYINRYTTTTNNNTDNNTNDNEILITVDADKSKFNVSDIIKRICDITFNETDTFAHFVKTSATEYDAAGTSGTENLLQKIVISANKQKPLDKKRKNTKSGLQIDTLDNKGLKERYILTLGGITIMDFTFIKEANPDSRYFNLYRDYKQNNFKFKWKPEYSSLNIKYMAQAYKLINDFFKTYEFEDGSVLVQDKNTRLSTLMNNPPFLVKNFIFTEAKPKKETPFDPSLNNLTPEKYQAFVEGIAKIENYTSELIDPENLYSIIFPSYKPVITLRVNTFFEQTTNSKVKDYLQNISSAPDKLNQNDINCEETVAELINIKDNLYNFMIKNNIIKNKSSAKEEINQLLKTTDFNLDDFFLGYCSQVENKTEMLKQLEYIRKLLKIIHATEFINYDEIFSILYPKELSFFSQGNNSVNAISMYIKENIKLTDKKLTHIFSFKTLGDFGQVLSFFFYNTKNKSENIIPENKYKYFVTFDRICARLSSIFNHGTLFENVNLVVSPLQPFEYKHSDNITTDETLSVALLTNKLKLKN